MQILNTWNFTRIIKNLSLSCNQVGYFDSNVKEKWEQIDNFRKWRRNMDRRKCCIQTSNSIDTTLETATRSSLTANWIDSHQRPRPHLPFVPEEERLVNRAVLKTSDNSSGWSPLTASRCDARRWIVAILLQIDGEARFSWLRLLTGVWKPKIVTLSKKGDSRANISLRGSVWAKCIELGNCERDGRRYLKPQTFQK